MMQTILNVSHFNTTWQDFSSTTSRFLRLYKRAIEAQPPNSGPMVVHCRYGFGIIEIVQM